MMELGENRYGKARVRVMKVERGAGRHRVDEWNVEVWLTGDFARCFLEGDNSVILPTDTMKNAVYSLARRSKEATIEGFAKELVAHFLATQAQIDGAGARVCSVGWAPIETQAGKHPVAFIQTGPEVAMATVTQKRGEAAQVAGGMEQVTILKTDRSAFSGFKRDRLTTLKETEDRLLGTAMTATWFYTKDAADFDAVRARIREALLATFAEHASKSVQQTLYAMGQAALETAAEVDRIFLSMPNKHCNLVDLSAFGQDNPNHIFVPIDEPHGAIEALVRRAK
ncbi:MAG TPA: urate oxidase [Acidobacteriaceae bacterium]|nr:urate oxidase [Acidobacteriaceae bacterium]